MHSTEPRQDPFSVLAPHSAERKRPVWTRRIAQSEARESPLERSDAILFTVPDRVRLRQGACPGAVCGRSSSSRLVWVLARRQVASRPSGGGCARLRPFPVDRFPYGDSETPGVLGLAAAWSSIPADGRRPCAPPPCGPRGRSLTLAPTLDPSTVAPSYWAISLRNILDKCPVAGGLEIAGRGRRQVVLGPNLRRAVPLPSIGG